MVSDCASEPLLCAMVTSFKQTLPPHPKNAYQ